MTYGEILREAGNDVRICARAGSTIDEAFRLIDDDAVCFFPDLVIINYGIVEICPRRELRFLSQWPVPNYFNNLLRGETYRFSTPTNRLRKKMGWLGNAVIRNIAKLVGLSWRWLSEDRFCQVTEAAVRLLLKETSAVVCLVGISPCSPRVRKLLPNADAAISSANRQLKALAAGFSSRVVFVDVEALLPEEKLPELVPDGVHFSATGHRLLAEAIQQQMSRHALGSGWSNVSG